VLFPLSPVVNAYTLPAGLLTAHDRYEDR